MKEKYTELDAALDQIHYPEGFLSDYDQLECLAGGRGTETFLVRKKGETKNRVAKCYDRSVYKVVHESAILKALSHEGLPEFVEEYQDETTICIVREFIEGTPLNKYMDGRNLSQLRTIFMIVRLCDILSYLHAQNPPVIHRDIKPSNIVVRPTDDVALIDFDIARTYEDDAEMDTQFIVTRAYAPPEQYGFSQTDCRADIYSLGVLLCFMLTGHTNVKHARIENNRLAAIVRKCTAFAPEQRFSSAAEVKKALRHAYGKNKGLMRACAACVLALALVCAGFALGRYTDVFMSTIEVQSLIFSEPLMEKAVRAQLCKHHGEPMMRDELPFVRVICIFGNEVATTQAVFKDGLKGWKLPRGSLSSLDDVALLPNLEELSVNYQSLSDLSPVSALRGLRYLDIRHTFVKDISALKDLPCLKNVVLFDTNISDISALATCPRLEELEIGKTLITSLNNLPALPALRWLSLRACSLSDIEGIERFQKLKHLCLTGTGIRDLSPLLLLQHLEEVYVDKSMRGAAEALGETPFTINYE